MDRFVTFYNNRQADSLLNLFADTSTAIKAHLYPQKSLDSLVWQLGEIKSQGDETTINNCGIIESYYEDIFPTIFTKAKFNIYLRYDGSGDIKGVEFRKFESM